MMAVEINGRFLSQPVTGVQRYATEIVRALDRRLASSSCLQRRYSFRVITPPHAEGSLELSHIDRMASGRLQGHAWEQLELPARVGRRVLLSLGNTAPLITRNVVTIHDAAVFAVPQAFSLAFRRWYRILIPLLGRTALRVVTISEFSRNELAARAGIRKERLDVVPQGCEHLERSQSDETVFERLPVRRGEYILAVGSQAPHKNIALLLEALRRMKTEAPPLVLAGRVNPRVFGPAAIGRSARIHSAGYVTDAELKALYQNAQCFVFPSRYEGFGIPPLEAMRSGCPVIVARAASLPEVCGDAALYCDPEDPDDLVRQIERLRNSPADREEYRRRGLERARGFTWDRAAGALLTLLDRLQPS
jgi:glycosyltransferase involved in cell wall biosynthesis